MSVIKRFLTGLPKWLLTGLTLAAICWLTLSPEPLGDTEIELFPGADKLAHAIMFGGLTAMFCLDSQRQKDWEAISGLRCLMGGTASGLLGIGIEYLQLWMQAGRGFEWADAYSDVAGSLLVAIGWIFLQPRWAAKI